jgi:hypothetical protein
MIALKDFIVYITETSSISVTSIKTQISTARIIIRNYSDDETVSEI